MCVGGVQKREQHREFLAFSPAIEPVRKLSLIEDVDREEVKETQYKDLQFKEDALAAMTSWTKDSLYQLRDYCRTLSDTTAYKILCRTTQPAHLVTSLAVISVASLCLSNKSAVATLSPLWTLLYLGSFSAHFGAQIWMTFVSGLALYFSLPRHTFGNVQKVLFPKYFLLNAFLSLITLSIFLRIKNKDLRTVETGVQAFAMSLCFFIELVIFLYFTPPLLALISTKTKIEKEAGVGLEVGKLEPGKLLQCPHYVRIHHAFRKVHMTIAIGNVCTMACTSLHLYYLACKLCALSL